MIKFRVWSNTYKTYDCYNPYSHTNDFYINQDGVLFSNFGDSIAEETDGEEFVIEQFTGLKDKNGREIYEGDIVEENRGKAVEVRYATDEEVGSCGCCFPKFIGAGFIIPSLNSSYANDLEIVGNIHEDKEVLNEV